jgi:ABC-type lipoprotein release transport system permease subunit
MKDIAGASAIVIATSLVAALYPAVKAARIKPLDALNFI